VSRVQDTLRAAYGSAYLTVLEGDRTDAAIMLALAELRIHEDEIDDELRDPDSPVSQGYACIAGNRPCPTAEYHVFQQIHITTDQEEER